MTEENIYCDHCGAKVVEYKHSLSIGLVRALYIVAIAGGKNVYLTDQKLTYSQRCNFQKLKYWNLVRKTDPLCDKGGYWDITPTGWDFIYGRIKLAKSVWTYRGKIERYEGKEIYFHEVTGGYKYKGHYASEAQVHQ